MFDRNSKNKKLNIKNITDQKLELKPDWIHPELRKEEVFFTNTNIKRFEKMEYISKRCGKNAYDGEGNRLYQKDWFPVFIQGSDLEKDEMSLQDVRRKWRACL